jgi:hypothetical protein
VLDKTPRLERLIEEAERAEATLVPPPPRRVPRIRTGALAAVFALSVGVLAAGWMWEERMLRPDPQALEEGRRLALRIAAQMIGDFVRRNGRYPESISEAVPVRLDVRYRKLDDGFEVQANVPGGRTITVKGR